MKSMPRAGVVDSTTATVLLTVAVWGSAFAAVRVGLTGYSPESLALLRFLTASLVLAGYAVVKRMQMPRFCDLPGLAGLGFVGLTASNLLVNAGEQSTPAGSASLIVASAPIFTLVLARLFLKERVPRSAWLGVGACFAGVVLICLKPGTGLQLAPGSLLLLLGAATSAVYSVGQKVFLSRYSPMQVATFAFWFGTLFLLIFAPDLLHQMSQARLPATWAALYLGVVPGALGYLGWGLIFSRMPASRAGSFLFLVPLSAILIAWLLLGEQPGFQSLIGGALVLLGTVLIQPDFPEHCS